jgi:hypothetical protein
VPPLQWQHPPCFELSGQGFSGARTQGVFAGRPFAARLFLFETSHGKLSKYYCSSIKGLRIIVVTCSP